MSVGPRPCPVPGGLATLAWLLAQLLGPLPSPCAALPNVRVWLTTADLRSRLTEGAPASFEESAPVAGATVIAIDSSRTFQSMLGLGASLEHSTCSNLARLPLVERERAIGRLVSPTRGIGMNLMRLCIGTSDFTGDPWYSYDDLPSGETDPALARFSIERDRAYVLPVIQLARSQNPGLLFFASPWSPPGWMKTTGSLTGGELLPRWYAAYAEYFVRFIRAYEAEGILIHAITVQNEPGVDRAREKDPRWFYPSCHWSAEQERNFVRDHLGPAFRRHGLKTRIWCYDHNYNTEPSKDSDGLAHPRAILRDGGAAAFVDGVAFHHYEGKPSGMTQWHEEFPGTPIHFTEGSVFSIYAAHDLIERLRNWASSYNAWVSILDEQGRPNNGPFPAKTAILRLRSDDLRVEELLEYYLYGHFMKFIPRGSTRIGSTEGNADFNNVAFRTPSGGVVLIAVNTTVKPRSFAVSWQGRALRASLPPTSTATFLW